MIGIKRIAEANKNDINIPNEPFALWGKMIPTYDGTKWAYTTEEFEKSEIRDMVFPDENYDFDELKKECFFVGAYNDSGKCVGLAIYRHYYFKYLYLDDLKVSKAYRGNGIGKLLLDEGKKIASENGYRGIYTIGQDNNLSACLFYIKSGFAIGGLNTQEYEGTSQADKSNIYFYLDL
ncbi:GNAT family N-acetyltransferase [Clostridium manihotivorum]|uniref:N-acetyltransferase n=1 Tax=Clostridium manihotivorum TaxID=2320868 RepID=A0A410DT21_9CLOT|nr:GNAT family N-acetyltransferase [Clostridium manihotivorum]QAA32191.1 N-acetyltransferase [Clostridium manihotivorum]